MRWIAILLAAAPLAAQTGTVTGSVVDAMTKLPVRGAAVELLRGRESAYSGATDGQGDFRFEGVAAGAYRLVVRNAEYLPLPPGHEAARPFTISAASLAAKLRAEIAPMGRLAGRVLNPSGEPMKGVIVGMRRLWDENWIRTTITDEKGVFQLRQLEPGPWVLAGLPAFRMTSANPENDPKPLPPPQAEEGQRTVWVATFFPGLMDYTGAERIVVRPGSVLDGYDIKLRTEPPRRISGVVVDVEGEPVAKAEVSLQDLTNKGVNSAFGVTDELGRFAFEAAVDGEWQVFAQAGQAAGYLKGYVDVTVSRRDAEGLEVRVLPAFPLGGMVQREEPRDQEGNRKVTRVYLVPHGMPQDMRTDVFHKQDGTLLFPQVFAGRYRVLPVGYVPGYYVASVWYGEQEVTTRVVEIASPPLPLRVIYRAGAPRATGKVERCGEGWVVFIPQDESLLDRDQFIHSAQCDADGRFTIENLRPANYYALAFDRVQKDLLEDVEFVRRLAPQAERVEARHGETVTVDLRLQTWPDF